MLSSSVDIMSHISPCTHEEADKRLILHAFDCARQVVDKIMHRTVDTDVVVLAISTFSRLAISEMWIAFGVRKQFRYIAIHDIVSALGDEKSQVLHVLQPGPHGCLMKKQLRYSHPLAKVLPCRMS